MNLKDALLAIAAGAFAVIWGAAGMIINHDTEIADLGYIFGGAFLVVGLGLWVYVLYKIKHPDIDPNS